MQDSSATGFGQLSKAGATALGIDSTAPPADVSKVVSAASTPSNSGFGTTSHWKSSYVNAVEET